MQLEREFELEVLGPPDLLLAPEKVFARLPGLVGLRREGSRLSGQLCGEARLLGRFCFPFESEFSGDGPVRLRPLPITGARLWAELGGEARAEEERLFYRVRLVLHAELPEGEKWGTRAFRRMAEAALENALKKSLLSLPRQIAV